MSKIKPILCIVVAIVLIVSIPLWGNLSNIDNTPQDNEDLSLMVVYNDTIEADEFIDEVQDETKAELSNADVAYEQNGDTVLTVDVEGDVNKTIVELENNPNVKEAQVDIRYELFNDEISDITPNDPKLNSQYWLKDYNPSKESYGHNIRDAWHYAKCKGSVEVAVIDTGCEVSHPDLHSNIDTTYMADCSSSDIKVGKVPDSLGHGTHVCGLIGAVANNDKGIAGVTYNAKVLPIKVFRDDGNCYSSSLCRAYDYLEDQIKAGHLKNLRLINMSLGGYTKGYYDNILEDKINHFYNDYGIITVCAAGNDKVSTPSYPSDFDKVISVMSVDKYGKDGPCDRNDAKDISAAGVSCISTYTNGKYCSMTGTSMASPIACGVIALVWSAKPKASASDVKNAIYNSAMPIVDKKSSGSHGNINAINALYKLGVISKSDLPDAIAGRGSTPTTTNPTKPTTHTTTKPKVYKTYFTNVDKGKTWIKLTWKKKTCTGYQIKRSTSSKMTNCKVLKTKNLSKKYTKLKRHKTYYFKVRTYRVKNGKTYYSDWSKKKIVKTK